jgi:hypothetical protein
MREIRLLQLGDANNTLIGNTATVLSRVQTAYDFIFDDADTVNVSGLPVLRNGRYETRVLERAARDYMRAHGYTEYPIAVTDLPLQDMLASSADTTMALVSTNDWAEFSTFPVVKGLEYLIAGVLLDMHDLSTVHYEKTRGCPNDYCDVRSDIDEGIRRAELCHGCRTSLLAALEKGAISLQEAIAVYRILDEIASRKICFVLMPFRPQFASAYESIRRAVESAGFLARRADEIFETRSIVQLIYEQLGRAELIVADLTERNPNVFYELGYAHALGKSTILVTQDAGDVPFDLRHRQHVLYDPNDLEMSLVPKIRAYFSGQTPT